MPLAAVLGSPIDHSLSPVLHSAGFAAAGLGDWDYLKFEVTDAELPSFVESADDVYVGFSVTMPGKFAAFNVAAEATDRARLLGAANTLVRLPDGGGWRADNTDTLGMLGALDEVLTADQIEPHSAVVVGAGGTSRPALWALAQRGVKDVTIVNRTDRRAELAALVDALGIQARFATYEDDLRSLSAAADVVVSTVPADVVNLYAEDLGHSAVVDVAYEPSPSRLVVAAAANGHATAAGEVVLANQAFSQFEQFTGVTAPQNEMRTALVKALSARAGAK